MKCNNCQAEIIKDAEFCGNCGSKVIRADNNINSSTLEMPEKKNNKKLFIVIGIIAIIIGIALAVFIINKNSKFEDPFDDIDNLTSVETTNSTREHEDVNSFTKNIEEDYNKGLLSKDDYIMQLAYSIYDVNKLDAKYKDSTLDFVEPIDLFEKFFDMYEDLSDETLVYIFKKYTLGDVVWNVEEDEQVVETDNNKLYDYEVRPLVSDDANLSKLDQVILSSNKNFLIYYTTDGKNAITKEKAKEIASSLETNVQKYKSKFELEYKYEAQYDWSPFNCPIGTAKGKACKLLKNNGIDVKYLDTAMPVFVVDTDVENTRAAGYYIPPIGDFSKTFIKIVDIFDDLDLKIDHAITAYAFPTFVVNSSSTNFDSTQITLAHELFHHYQRYICGDGSYGECKSGNFTLETTADYASSSIVEVESSETNLNSHASMYAVDVDSSIDKIGYKQYGDAGVGYGAFVFTYNYNEIIDDGYKHLFDSLKTTESLKYLYDKAGDKYKDVLVTTAKKNLTLDYNNKLLIPKKNGIIFYPENYKQINNKQAVEINYSSMNYYYIEPMNYSEKSQLSFNGDSSDLSLLLFIKENNSYKYLDMYTLDKEFVINIEDFYNYSELVVAIVNSQISGTLSYSYELSDNENKTPTVTSKMLGLTTLEDAIGEASSIICYEISEDETYINTMQFKLSFDKKEQISDMYFKIGIEIKDYDSNNPAFAITQKIMSNLINAQKLLYQETLKNFDVITTESVNKYTITYKVNSNYHEALNNNFNINGYDKYTIFKTMKQEGFKCELEK